MSSEIEVYFLDDSEYADFEANQKGFRLDVYVKIKEAYFKVNVYDIIRLKQEFEIAVKSEGYYSVDPNLVIVEDVNKKDIIFTIKKLYSQKYFEEIKPIENLNIGELKKIQ